MGDLAKKTGAGTGKSGSNLNSPMSPMSSAPFTNDHLQMLKLRVNKKAAFEHFQMYIDLLDVFKIL